MRSFSRKNAIFPRIIFAYYILKSSEIYLLIEFCNLYAHILYKYGEKFYHDLELYFDHLQKIEPRGLYSKFYSR